MAGQTRNKAGKGNKRPRLRYFFLNGKLHKKLHINRPADVITCWNYTDGRVAKYNYTDTLRHYKPAFSTVQAAEMLNRKRLAMQLLVIEGKIEKPQFTYSIDENRRMYQYMWSEEDIFAAHDYFTTTHYGRPRKDGLATPKPLPTPRELRAMIHDENILYVKEGDTYVPTWKANL